VISGHKYGFDNPIDLVAVGNEIWVANGAGNSLTVLNATTGALIHYLR
jgi:hypothetical protein